MAISVIIHIAGEASVVGEIEELPKSTDTLITVSNLRLRDGKDVHYIEPNVTKVIFPIAKLGLIEILEGTDEESLIGFVRE